MKKLYILYLIFIITCRLIEGTPPSGSSGHPEAATGTADTINPYSLIKVDSFRLDIIPPSSGVQFYRNGIVFLSNSKAEGKMLQSHTSFGNVEAYYAIITDTSAGPHTAFSTSFPYEVPCEAMTFNNDFSLMYYSKRPGNKGAEKIYQARYQLTKNGKRDWISESRPLSFCSGSTTYSHPALSSDGEKMIFSSNAAGSFGGLDLYISKKDGEGWSEPENLGSLINSSGNEITPFLDQQNNLYFSSDSHEAIGGYDVYISGYTGYGWSKPVNLTKGINTNEDDLAFTVSRPDGVSAFYTRRSKTGEEPARVYRVTFRDKSALNKMNNLPEAFKYIAGIEVSAGQPAVVAAATQPVVKQPDKEVAQVITKNVEPEKKTVNEAEKKAVSESVKNTEKIVTGTKPPVTKPPVTQQAVPGAVVYRVQFAASTKPKGSYEVTAGGKTYKTFEYFYSGGYRSCAGEFSTIAPAASLQKAFKQAGYTDAFVVAFKNNVRTLDPALFK
jgi:hypothetical protein